MPFPFSIRYNKRLKAIITPDNQQEALLYIQKRIEEDKADNIVIENNQISYKGSTSNRRGLFGSVDDGVFNFKRKGNLSILCYRINMKRVFTIILILCTLSELTCIGSGDWWFGIIAFLWLGGINWIIAVTQHEAVAASIAIGIDDLFHVNPPKEEDKEKLKSWF